MDELVEIDEELNEEYEIEYGASNIINRNKIEKLEVDENLKNVQTMFRTFKKSYGKYNRKIKKTNLDVLKEKEQFDLLLVEKKIIIQEMNDLIQAVPNNEEYNKILDEKQQAYKKLTMEYLTLDENRLVQEQIVAEFKSDVHALKDLIIDGTNITNELNQKIQFTEMEIGRKKKDLIRSTKVLNSKGIKLRGEEISKEKKNALTLQVNLLNIEIRMKTDRIEELRDLHLKSIMKLDIREFDLNNKKNEIILLNQLKYIECKKEIDITMNMETLNKKMFDLRKEIIDMNILLPDEVAKLASFQVKLDKLLESWKVLVVQMNQQQHYVEVLTFFMKRVMEEKYKAEASIPILNKKRDNLVEMINEMNKLTLTN